MARRVCGIRVREVFRLGGEDDTAATHHSSQSSLVRVNIGGGYHMFCSNSFYCWFTLRWINSRSWLFLPTVHPISMSTMLWWPLRRSHRPSLHPRKNLCLWNPYAPCPVISIPLMIFWSCVTVGENDIFYIGNRRCIGAPIYRREMTIHRRVLTKRSTIDFVQKQAAHFL